jgi:LPS sulfotransferase NodH
MAPAYLVCATERSGSTLLCELLAATGVAGRPEEYFESLSATGRARQPREYFPEDADPSILGLRAVQTAQWRAGDRDAEIEPVFHAGAIAHLKARQEEHAAAWRAWFAERGIDPLEIVYEEFAQEPRPAICGVLDHIGVPSAGVPVPEPPTRRQSDSRSQEWVDRFRDEVPA